MPPTDSRPLSIIRITSGPAAMRASLVSGVNGLSRPVSTPASTAPAASIRESAPEPLPPMRWTAALPRMQRKATLGLLPSGTVAFAAERSSAIRELRALPASGTPSACSMWVVRVRTSGSFVAGSRTTTGTPASRIWSMASLGPVSLSAYRRGRTVD
ncbi:hypothetical protein QF037_004653 [Streptomyces canus]|nr:hypothetical protein [Streptomyces canus]